MRVNINRISAQLEININKLIGMRTKYKLE